jgi:hypothetical protein
MTSVRPDVRCGHCKILGINGCARQRQKAGGIRKVINARLGIKDGDTVWDGATFRQVIDEIYSDGRSRTIHGTNDKLGYDWSVTRMLSEYFARLCQLHGLGGTKPFN